MLLVIDNGSLSVASLCGVLEELGVPFDLRGHASEPDLAAYSGVVLSGRARPSVESNRNNARIILRACSTRLPLLGICFGAEAIVLTCGGALRRMDRPWRGARSITRVRENLLIREANLVVHESHRYQIARLPPGYDRLARSCVCENEAVKCLGAEVYGVQFHPESSGESGKRILTNFVEICRRSRSTANT